MLALPYAIRRKTMNLDDLTKYMTVEVADLIRRSAPSLPANMVMKRLGVSQDTPTFIMELELDADGVGTRTVLVQFTAEANIYEVTKPVVASTRPHHIDHTQGMVPCQVNYSRPHRHTATDSPCVGEAGNAGVCTVIDCEYMGD